MSSRPASMPPVTVEPIALRIVTAYLVRGTRTILVDTGLPGQEGRLLQALTGPRSDVDLAAIVVTHLHADHAGNAKGLAERLGIPILTSVAGAAYAHEGVNAPGSATSVVAAVTGALGLVPRHFAPFRPDHVLRSGDRLDTLGVPASVLATPGHTDHCISLVCDDGVALLGDVVSGGPVRRRVPGPPFLLHDAVAWRSSLGRLASVPWSTAFLGHGGPVSRSAFDTFMRRQWREADRAVGAHARS